MSPIFKWGVWTNFQSLIYSNPVWSFRHENHSLTPLFRDGPLLSQDPQEIFPDWIISLWKLSIPKQWGQRIQLDSSQWSHLESCCDIFRRTMQLESQRVEFLWPVSSFGSGGSHSASISFSFLNCQMKLEMPSLQAHYEDQVEGPRMKFASRSV